MKILPFISLVLLLCSCKLNQQDLAKSKLQSLRKENNIGVQVRGDGNFDFRKDAYDFSEYREFKIFRRKIPKDFPKDYIEYANSEIVVEIFAILGGEYLNYHPYLNDGIGNKKGWYDSFPQIFRNFEELEDVFLNGGEIVYKEYNRNNRDNRDNIIRKINVIKNENEKDYVFLTQDRGEFSYAINLEYLKEVFSKEKAKKSICNNKEAVGNNNSRMVEYPCNKEEDQAFKEYLRKKYELEKPEREKQAREREEIRVTKDNSIKTEEEDNTELELEEDDSQES